MEFAPRTSIGGVSLPRPDPAQVPDGPGAYLFRDADARVIYGRADFENVWLGGSAGIVYVIYPDGVPLPPNVEGFDKNW